MIRNVDVLGKCLQRTGDDKIDIHDQGQSSGIVRYNTIKQCLETFDGVSWINISRDIKIGLDPEAEAAIEWAKTQIKHRNNMLETLDKELSKNVSLKEAYEHFRTMAALVYERNHNGEG